jgi:two-component system, OmpR family, KDP operon response regulator KdpE
LLQRSLGREGLLVHLARTSDEALGATFLRRPDMVILGVDLPGMPAADLIQQLRASHEMSIIALGERSNGLGVAGALDAGADDFLFKPLSVAELLARVRAVLRRAQAKQCRSSIAIGDVEVDLVRRSVSRGGRPVPVNRTEYLVIQQLVLHAGRVLTHAALLTAVWGAEYRDEVARIRYWIARVRRRLGIAPGEDGPLITYPGVGYALDPEGVLRSGTRRPNETGPLLSPNEAA